MFIANIYTNELGSYVEFWFLALKMNEGGLQSYIHLRLSHLLYCNIASGYRSFFKTCFSVFNVPFSCTDFPKFVVADEKLEKLALI